MSTTERTTGDLVATLQRLADALERQGNAPPPGATPLPPLLSADATAKLLDAARSTLYAWDQEGRIPQPVRIGSRTYWRGSELQEWVAAGCPCRERWNLLRKDA